MAQKILFLSVSAGAGHMRAAEALRLTAEQNLPDVVTRHLDVMEYVPSAMRKLYTDFYILLVNSYPTLWGTWAPAICARRSANLRPMPSSAPTFCPPKC
jgi:hypothetical protein